jgi:group I intron endonuclease
LKNYLNNSFLINKKNANQPITKALLKYGTENFSVIILEYIDKDFIFDRETFWIVNLKPYYNILKSGGSSIGYKHSDTIKLFLSELAKNRKNSEETKLLIANALKGELNPFYGKSHNIESINKIIASKSLGKIYIYNSIKELQVIFPSITTLSNTINSSINFIKKVIIEGIMFRG